MNTDRAFLVIDMQQEDGFSLHDLHRVIDNNAASIAATRNAGIPVIYTRHINAADSSDLAWVVGLLVPATTYYWAMRRSLQTS